MEINSSRPASKKRRILLGCGGVLGLVVVFLFWWSRNPIVFTLPEGLLSEVTARQLEDPAGDAIVVELELSGDDTSYRITEFSVNRELAAKLGLSPPAGFKEEPVPLEEEDRTDPETVKFVAEWNAENLRWTCDLEIASGEPIVVRIPATDPSAVSGPVSISYESVSTLGGHWSSTTLVVNETAEAESELLPDPEVNATG